MTVQFEELRRQINWARFDQELAAEGKENKRDMRWYQGTWISIQPVQVDQDTIAWWPCNTSCCIAGHTVLSHGAQPIMRASLEALEFSGEYVRYEGETRDISELARELLGLSRSDADLLFDACNSIERLDEIVDLLEERELARA